MKNINIANKLIIIFCILVVILLSIKIMNSPQIYWFSRRYLPFIFVIFFFMVHFLENKKLNIIILLFFLILQFFSYQHLDNYSGLKQTLISNKEKFDKNKFYLYDESVDYRKEISFFQNIYDLKMIPYEKYQEIQKELDYFLLTHKDCSFMGYTQVQTIKVFYKEIKHTLPKANFLLLQFPKLPKDYFKRDYLINICSPKND